jgi:hypothetical protein
MNQERMVARAARCKDINQLNAGPLDHTTMVP